MLHHTLVRRAALFAMLVAASLTPRLASAAPSHPVAFPGGAGSLLNHLGHGARFDRLVRGHIHLPASLSPASARDVTDPIALQIQLPAGATQPTGGVITVAQADDPSGANLFVSLHSETYAAAGMESGYLQTTGLPIGTGGASGAAEWLGSLYPTDAAATAQVAETDAKLAGEGLKPVSCGTGCDLWGIPLTVTNTDKTTTNLIFFYAIFAEGNVVGELGLLVTATTEQNDNTDVANVFNQLFHAVNTTLNAAQPAASPTPTATATTPATPTLSIEGIVIERKVKGKFKLVHKFAAKQQVVFVTAVKIGNAPSGQTLNPTPTIKFSVKGHGIGADHMQYGATLSDGALGYDWVTSFHTSKKVRVKALVIARLGAVVARASITFTLTKK